MLKRKEAKKQSLVETVNPAPNASGNNRTPAENRSQGFPFAMCMTQPKTAMEKLKPQ
jgi:hypothetical protein